MVGDLTPSGRAKLLRERAARVKNLAAAAAAEGNHREAEAYKASARQLEREAKQWEKKAKKLRKGK